jgi:FAD:protein FMN transferase
VLSTTSSSVNPCLAGFFITLFLLGGISAEGSQNLPAKDRQQHDKSCATLQSFEAVEPHMGTLFRVKLYAASQEQAQSAFRLAFARIEALDNLLSDYKPESELSRVTTLAVGRPVPVSSDLFHVLIAAQQISQETEGAFDVTLGPVIRLWREARKTGRPPTPDALREAARFCGYKKMKLGAKDSTVEFEQVGMKLDLGGIAKGYAADEALVVLNKSGIKSALVAASGDLAFGDPPPGKKGWSIGIDSFDSARAPFTKTLVLANSAVSTSGDTEQYLDAGGKHYSHIIDPASDMGLTRRMTVTVVARRGLAADPFATAVDVMGAERGLAFIERQPEAAALIIVREGAAPRTIESTRFQRLSVQAN